jgi:hypothetical protein
MVIISVGAALFSIEFIRFAIPFSRLLLRLEESFFDVIIGCNSSLNISSSLCADPFAL